MTRPEFHCKSCMRHVFGMPASTASGRPLCATCVAKIKGNVDAAPIQKMPGLTQMHRKRSQARAHAKTYASGKVQPWMTE